MSDSVLLELHGVGKRYPRVHGRRDRLASVIDAIAGRPYRKNTQVLSGIGFTLRRGESLGLIGENGAGKSTLLRMICGVAEASEGSILRRGSVAPLLELGAGFHPDYSGRDNIRMNALLLGMPAADFEAKVQQIIDFAEIGAYIDEPVKHYSSGMKVRLGFAVVASAKPDLLITDEVLAVGDEAFQKKCIAWIEGYLREGGTLLLVSHGMYHVQKLCKHALWLNQGRVEAYGDVFDVTQRYLAYQESKSTRRRAEERALAATGDYAVTIVAINGETRDVPVVLAMRTTLDVDVTVYSADGRAPVFAVGLKRHDGTPVYGVSSELDGIQPVAVSEHVFRFSICYPELALLPGTYTIALHAMDPEAIRLFDTVERSLVVTGRTREVGLVQLSHRWHTQ
ncbi:MAG: ABC transporter ATP-binding protein [Xanthomonadales bacterium]|nr:ABC transporter ATP-binding protein [Xanthomonadales bacterium]MBK7144174.1 ABC transporter ATP-binding protein [Xanthomonadales bacterium]MCC6560056.1 ABC transporter ATP-binding protein [Xanthomonadales bacterium]